MLDSLAASFTSEIGGVRERELANLMAKPLIEDLRNLGVTAYRFGPRDQLPAGRWLLQGTFVQIDEGNRLERALIGFGQCATELDVVASLSDFRCDHPRPFCEVDSGCGVLCGAGGEEPYSAQVESKWCNSSYFARQFGAL